MRNSRKEVLAHPDPVKPKKVAEEFFFTVSSKLPGEPWTGAENDGALKRCESHTGFKCHLSSNVFLRSKQYTTGEISTNVASLGNKRRDYMIVIVIREFVYVCQRSTPGAYLKLATQMLFKTGPDETLATKGPL